MKQFFSTLLQEYIETWYRDDLILGVDRYHCEDGLYTNKFRIIPNTNDMDIVGHIRFHELVFEDFEEACRVCESIKLK